MTKNEGDYLVSMVKEKRLQQYAERCEQTLRQHNERSETVREFDRRVAIIRGTK